ncbi:MAG: hypothetical protein H0V07_05240 [Propionibacteriales bacterium]|nr:hypothetical protein [Propionibacteriales bacterium]
MAEHHHGSTPAAWTAVTIILLGFFVGAAGLIADAWLIFWVGVGLVVAACVVGKVMQAMGMGTR